MKLTTLAAACLLATATAGAHAQAWLDVYAPPNNSILLGLSDYGQSGVTVQSVGNVLLPSSPGAFVAIGGNSSQFGFGGTLDISGNGQLISGNTTAGNGFSQAGIYNVGSGTWTALGSLGYNATSTVGSTGLRQQSISNAISGDGSVVVGHAYHNTTGTTGSRTHPVVFRDGLVIDLNPAATTQTGTALSVSRDGSIVTGYASNSAVGSIWRWNGTSYVASNPTIQHPVSGATVNIQAAAVSSNGAWVAGGSVNALATNYAPVGTFPSITYSPATLWNMQTQSAIVIPYDHVIDPTGGPDPILNMKATVHGVSDNGLVIGTFNQCLGCGTGLLQQDTWIYDASSGITLSFDSYLASLGVALAPTQHVWSLGAISADGSAISGIYFDTATSTSSAFLLHTAVVPEPTTCAMFGIGLLALALRRVRAMNGH